MAIGKTVKLVSRAKFIDKMCLNPIKIPNNSSVLSRYYLSKGYRSVPCGKCYECQQTKSLEWEYRSWWQFRDTRKHSGYCLFDTLTYDSPPMISQFLGDSGIDFPCFSLPDIQSFMNRLQQALRHRYHYSKKESLPIKYFLSAEYGTKEQYVDSRCRIRKATHRPHYHVVFYVMDPKISPLSLSYLINRSWKHGRTDGIPWKSKQYVLKKRVIDGSSWNFEAVRLNQYVTKYVQKDCQFQKTIDARLWSFMYSKYQEHCRHVGEQYEFDFDNMQLDVDGFPICAGTKLVEQNFQSWLRSSAAKSLFLKAKHCVEQFHKQSQQFGALLLDELDLPYLWHTGCQKYRKGDGSVVDVKLPLYYFRKLFQEQVSNGDKWSWSNTDLGCQYVMKRQHDLVHDLAFDIYCTFKTFGKEVYFDPKQLAYYSVVLKDTIGYIDVPYSRFDVMKHPYYHQRKDKRSGKFFLWQEYDDRCSLRFLSSDFLSLSFNDEHSWTEAIDSDYVIHGFDEILADYRIMKYRLKRDKQTRYENQQRVRKLFRSHDAQLTLDF